MTPDEKARLALDDARRELEALGYERDWRRMYVAIHRIARAAWEAGLDAGSLSSYAELGRRQEPSWLPPKETP